ncbi:C12A2 protein, partial [Acromyrmex charruanus]
KGSRSPAFSQGKLWHDFRSKVNPHTMQPRMIKAHVSQINEVASEFMEKIRALQDPETLELPSVFEKTPNELLKWALELNTSTKVKYETMNNSTNLHDCSILEKLLHIDKVTAQVMALDMLMANMYSNNMYIDRTGNVSGSLLYYTANNLEEKLRKEVMFVLRDKTSPVTQNVLNQKRYAKVCIKESLRLFAIAVSILRTMQKDVCLGGYKIPAGFDVMACHSLVIRNFRIEWHHGPLEYESRFINTLVSSMRFKILTILIYARGQKAFRRNVVAWKLQIFSKFVEKHARVCMSSGLNSIKI